VAIRDDFTFFWESSPRIIRVDSPSLALTIQDLVDTVRAEEDELLNLDNPHLINAAGKADLGGGLLTGVTVTLQNALVEFEERPGPANVQATITGGNLTAIGSSDDTISPVNPSSFVQVVLQQSVSATIQSIESIEDTVNDTNAVVAILQQLARNKMITDPETGLMSIYSSSDPNVAVYTARLYEDTAGNNLYQGRGVQYRERIE